MLDTWIVKLIAELLGAFLAAEAFFPSSIFHGETRQADGRFADAPFRNFPPKFPDRFDVSGIVGELPGFYISPGISCRSSISIRAFDLSVILHAGFATGIAGFTGASRDFSVLSRTAFATPFSALVPEMRFGDSAETFRFKSTISCGYASNNQAFRMVLEPRERRIGSRFNSLSPQ